MNNEVCHALRANIFERNSFLPTNLFVWCGSHWWAINQLYDATLWFHLKRKWRLNACFSWFNCNSVVTLRMWISGLVFSFFFFFYVLSPAPSLFCLLGLTSKVAYRVVSVMPAIKIFWSRFAQCLRTAWCEHTSFVIRLNTFRTSVNPT